MIVRGTSLLYEIPDGWQYFRDGNRLVLQGPNKEELIISGSRAQGRDPEAGLAPVRERLFQMAVASVNHGASHPELTVTRPLERDLRNRGLDCWTLHCQTTSGDTLFLQSIIRTDDGVTLITFEAPNTPTSSETYETFIRSVCTNIEEA